VDISHTVVIPSPLFPGFTLCTSFTVCWQHCLNAVHYSYAEEHDRQDSPHCIWILWCISGPSVPSLRRSLIIMQCFTMLDIQRGAILFLTDVECCGIYSGEADLNNDSQLYQNPECHKPDFQDRHMSWIVLSFCNMNIISLQMRTEDRLTSADMSFMRHAACYTFSNHNERIEEIMTVQMLSFYATLCMKLEVTYWNNEFW
jgi:hypothetical protein